MRIMSAMIAAGVIALAVLVIIPQILDYYSPLNSCFRAVYERNLEEEHELMCTVIFGDYEP